MLLQTLDMPKQAYLAKALFGNVVFASFA